MNGITVCPRTEMKKKSDIFTLGVVNINKKVSQFHFKWLLFLVWEGMVNRIHSTNWNDLAGLG